MWRKWRVRVCLRWTKCTEMLKNAIAYAEICDYIRIFANLYINKYSKCINKYSKFWKCHCVRENMRYAHFCKICEICCDRMIAINRYPYVMEFLYTYYSLFWDRYKLIRFRGRSQKVKGQRITRYERVHPVHLINKTYNTSTRRPQTFGPSRLTWATDSPKLADIVTTTTIAIYYYPAPKLILILPSHGG